MGGGDMGWWYGEAWEGWGRGYGVVGGWEGRWGGRGRG